MVGVDPFSAAAIGAAYDRVAPDYHAAFGDDLVRLALDRAVLDDAAARLGPGEAVLDLGCGTGSAGAYLAAGGRVVVGCDLSLGMLGNVPTGAGLALVQADARALPLAEGAFGLVVAFYSLHHLARSELSSALAEAARVLRPHGSLLVATHLGHGDVTTGEFLGHDVEPIGASFYSPEEVAEQVTSAGFGVDEVRRRAPLGHEYPSERIYLVARRQS